MLPSLFAVSSWGFTDTNDTVATSPRIEFRRLFWDAFERTRSPELTL